MIWKLYFGENLECSEWPPNDLECYKGRPKVPHYYMLNYYRESQISLSFAPRPPVFQITDVFLFLHRVQWWIRNVRKKIFKNWKLKISKIPNVVLWGPLGGKFRTSWKTFGWDFRWSSVLKFSLPLSPMFNKNKINR